MGKRWLLFILLFLTSSTVGAISLTPAQQTIQFVPEEQLNLSISVGNRGGSLQNVTLSFGGELAKYVQFEEKHLLIPPSKSESIHFQILFPRTIKKPGKQLIEIYATEEPIGEVEEGILPRTSVTALLWVEVPYEGKYAELTISTHDVNIGEPVIFTILMHNLAKQTIQSASTTIDIFDLNNKLVETLSTPPISLEPLSSLQLKSSFQTKEQQPGPYTATAILSYDGEQTREHVLEFRVGTLYVAITNYTSTFEKDKVNPFILEVTNQWNLPIKNLYGEIEIAKEGKVIGSILKTPSVKLQPWEKTDLTTFWDTTDLETGKYQATITLHYNGEITTKTIDIAIEKEFALNMTTLLVGIIILIILIDLIIWIYHKKKQNEEDY